MHAPLWRSDYPRCVGKRVAIVQSCYIPWKGYFDLINAVDEFVLFDDRQFTRRDWRNRNTVKTAKGPIWITIPVKKKGRYHQRIDETLVDGEAWRERHWRTLVHNYGRAPYFHAYAPRLEELFRSRDERRLSLVNRAFLEAVCETLGIRTRFSWSTDYDAEGERSERLVSLCLATGATVYVSGPSARVYLDEDLFKRHGIELRYFDYSGYRTYPQLYPPFTHNVSIVDLLFCTGPAARTYMKTFPESEVEAAASVA